jgi:hypothetical protein
MDEVESIYLNPHLATGAIVIADRKNMDIDVFMSSKKYGEFVKRLLEELGTKKCIFYIYTAKENVSFVLKDQEPVCKKFGIKFKKGIIDGDFALWDTVETKIIDKLINFIISMRWEVYYFETKDVRICQTNDNFYYLEPKTKNDENYRKLWETCKKALSKMEQ